MEQSRQEVDKKDKTIKREAFQVSKAMKRFSFYRSMPSLANRPRVA